MASGFLSKSCFEGHDFSLKGMCMRGGHWLLASGHTFARTVDNADAKCVDTGTLGGCVTRTANVTIRPMGADDKPCPTALLPADEEESGTI